MEDYLTLPGGKSNLHRVPPYVLNPAFQKYFSIRFPYEDSRQEHIHHTKCS